MATRIPGMMSSKGPKRALTPGIRPEFILGSRPENQRAPLPGKKIKPQAAGTRDYAKAISGDGTASFAKDMGP